MAARRHKIEALREKVGAMQMELREMERSERRGTPAANGSLLAKMQQLMQLPEKQERSSRGSREYLSQTMRLDGRDNTREKSARKREMEQLERGISPALNDIMNRLDSQYYTAKPTPPASPKQIQFNSTTSFSKRYQYTEFAMRREASKDSKLKTYDQRKTDVILNPPPAKECGIKIVKKPERSPAQMLTENPKSNPNLYFYSNRPAVLDRKGGVTDKNRSSLVISPSSQAVTTDRKTSVQKKQRSQRKHYERYVRENLLSTII